MISIIIPLYNQGKELDKCLASIEKQTYQNFEIIIVNDRSCVKLSKIYKKYKQTFGYKLELLNNQSNHGAPYSRNKGYERSKGEFLLFCDADIVMEPEMLQTMLDALKNNRNVSYAYSSFKFGLKKFKLCKFSIEKLKMMPYIHTSSLIRREHFVKFDENLKKFQDWDLWLSLLGNHHVGIWIDKTLFKIIQTNATMSNWLPSPFYKLFPFLPEVRRYNSAVQIIKNKHNLS